MGAFRDDLNEDQIKRLNEYSENFLKKYNLTNKELFGIEC